jgi:hypothetical protein
MSQPSKIRDPRDRILNSHAPNLANLEKPLRQLLTTVRYWEGVRPKDIQRELGRNIRIRRDRTVLFNGLTQVQRSVNFGEDHQYILGNLYYYLFIYFKQRLSDRENPVDPTLYPLLHACFSDKLPIPKGFDRLLTKDDFARTAIRKFCETHQGTYFGYRFGTSRNVRVSGEQTIVKILIKIFPWEYGFAHYEILYRGRNDRQHRGPYNRVIDGPICVIGNRAHFIGQEDTRDHLSYMVWFHYGGQKGPAIGDEYRKGIVTASNPDEKIFAAQLVYRRISENLDQKIESSEIGVFPSSELTETDDALKQILENGWLKNTGRQGDVLELSPIDSPHS